MHAESEPSCVQKTSTWPFYTELTQQRVAELVRQGRTYSSVEDPDICRFERDFAALLSPGHHGVFCSTGTSALYSAYFSLGLDPGGEVIVPTNTFRATVTPLLLLNLRPVFCDATKPHGELNLMMAESLITSRTQALVLAHMWGHLGDMIQARRIADRYSIALVEDCSHAHGSSRDGVAVGSLADVAIFSVGTKKLVSGGNGGMLLSRNRQVIERALLLGHPRARITGLISDPELLPFVSTGWGANFRGSPISAVLALDHLDRLDETLRIKAAHAKTLAACLERCIPELVPLVPIESARRSGLYALKYHWRGEGVSAITLVEQMRAGGVPCTASSPPLHLQPIFQTPPRTSVFAGAPDAPVVNHDFPVAESMARTQVEIESRALYRDDDTSQRYAEAIERVAEHLFL